jgi:anti-sigma regulatory factor (Ser/Thr protein kinase)
MTLGVERFYVNGEPDLTVAVLWPTRASLLAEASERDRTILATIISELGSNIVKYARRGVIDIVRVERGQAIDIDITAEDFGPGIENVERAMADHFSTGGTLGLGLPGVRRMANAFNIRSVIGSGTVVFASKRIRGPLSPHATPTNVDSPLLAVKRPVYWSLSVRTQPRMGEHAIGDCGLAVETPDGLLLAMLDVSGHGKRANVVADNLAATLRAHASADLVAVMQHLFKAAQGTVGAAVGLAFVEPNLNQFRYMGIGNTRCAKLGKISWRGVSRDGVLGGRWPTPYEQTAPLETDDCLILWTDGIAENAIDNLRGMAAMRSAKDIAGRLVRESARPYDDAGCVVMKWHK